MAPRNSYILTDDLLRNIVGHFLADDTGGIMIDKAAMQALLRVSRQFRRVACAFVLRLRLHLTGDNAASDASMIALCTECTSLKLRCESLPRLAVLVSMLSMLPPHPKMREVSVDARVALTDKQVTQIATAFPNMMTFEAAGEWDAVLLASGINAANLRWSIGIAGFADREFSVGKLLGPLRCNENVRRLLVTDHGTTPTPDSDDYARDMRYMLERVAKSFPSLERFALRRDIVAHDASLLHLHRLSALKRLTSVSVQVHTVTSDFMSSLARLQYLKDIDLRDLSSMVDKEAFSGLRPGVFANLTRLSFPNARFNAMYVCTKEALLRAAPRVSLAGGVLIGTAIDVAATPEAARSFRMLVRRGMVGAELRFASGIELSDWAQRMPDRVEGVKDVHFYNGTYQTQLHQSILRIMRACTSVSNVHASPVAFVHAAAGAMRRSGIRAIWHFRTRTPYDDEQADQFSKNLETVLKRFPRAGTMPALDLCMPEPIATRCAAFAQDYNVRIVAIQ
jgi:hypothetical protein